MLTPLPMLTPILLPHQVIIYPGTYAYYRWRNHQKSKVWDVMTSEEKSHYLATTTQEENQR
jgi:hypothetical protein